MWSDPLQESRPPNASYFVEEGELEDEPEQFQDKPKDQDEKLNEIKITAQGEEPKPIFINASLSREMREQVIQLLKEYKDVFVWTYAQMPHLDPQLVSHKLNIKEGCKPVKQVSKNFKPELEVQIKEEIHKLVDVGFIKPVQHLTWLANIIPVRRRMDRSDAVLILEI